MTSARRFRLLLPLLLSLLWLPADQTRAQPPALAALQERIVEVVEQVTPAIVEVQGRGALFSGVIVSPQGHVLTAGHTINPGQRYTVRLTDGRRLASQALGICEQMQGERLDCGLIKITDPEDLPYLPLGSSAQLQTGQPCLSISYPGGQRQAGEPIVRLGVIGRSLRGGRMIQSTALMEPGDSGGPLLDLDGRVIGIHSRIGPRMDQNYDVPIDVFKTYWDQLNVAEAFSVQDGRPVPKLGFVGQDSPDQNGITIVSIVQGSIAEQIGLQPDDVLTRLQDSSLTGLSDLRVQLLRAIDTNPEQLSLAVLRGEDQVEYWLPTARLVYPVAQRIAGLDEPAAEPPSIAELDLRGLTRQLAANSGALSGSCQPVTSQIDDRTMNLLATAIAQTPYWISKSSQVGERASLTQADQSIELEVVARDPTHDLVLLRAPQVSTVGIPLTVPEMPPLVRGQLLWSPHANGSGQLSVVGSSEFASARVASRGYMGVVLRDYQQGGVVLTEVDDGAAGRAGLQPGDVIIRVDSTRISNRNEMLKLLGSVDPGTRINTTYRRAGKEMQVEVTLGAPPNNSDHAADLIDKSLRRDGFPRVFSHDAALSPEACGGPVFDAQGAFVGLNIARYSRVRNFALPAEVVVDFARQHIPHTGGSSD